MTKWLVEALGVYSKSRFYSVMASSELDARILAFSLDGGFPRWMAVLDDGHIELVKMYTQVITHDSIDC
jgi:hypothetical protein